MVGMLYEGKYVYLCFVGLDFNVKIEKKNCVVDIFIVFYVLKLVYCIIYVYVNVGKEEIYVLI